MTKSGFIRLIKFGMVGGSGVVVNLGVVALLRFITELPLEIRSLLAIETAIITNFILNYHWTWKDRKSDASGHKRLVFIKFNTSSGLIAFIFNYLPLLLFVNLLGWNEDLSNIIGIGVASLANFLISHFWIITFIIFSYKIYYNKL